MRVLVVACSQYKGGTSGSDEIYKSFVKHWDADFDVWILKGVDFKPFFLSYILRIFMSCFMALVRRNKYDVVYSASDFLPDVLPCVILKLRGSKWLAGFFLTAFKYNKIHYHTQKIVKKLINKYADMVVVTNPTMYDQFPDKRKTWINGGIHKELVGLRHAVDEYDVVFAGRIHKTKGVQSLINIWDQIKKRKRNATMAVVGDGDLGVDWLRQRLDCEGVDFFGFLGEERYLLYNRCKVAVYPTPKAYDHFSMSPVEAMACGCPVVSFDTETVRFMNPGGWYMAKNIGEFADKVVYNLDDERRALRGDLARQWAMNFDYELQAKRVEQDVKGIL